MNKKHIILAVVALAVAIAVGFCVFFATHVSIGGEYFAKSAQIWDLSHQDLTPEDYLSLHSRYPDTQILWSVPFQGERYPCNAQSITIRTLTEEEIPLLDFLPQLTQVDATECTDYAALLALLQRRPDLQILYKFSLGGMDCSLFVPELTVENADAAELLEKLPLLPRLSSLTLEGTLPSPEELTTLRAAFPSIVFHYSVDLCGESYPSNTENLDLSGLPVTAQELSAVLPLLPQLQSVSLQKTGLTDGELKALATQFPDIFFLCTLDFAGVPCSTDATQIDLSRRKVTPEMVDSMLPFFPYLTKLDLSYCNIDDETMDALNRRHPNVSIVWTVLIRFIPVRTDDTIFFPSSINEKYMPNEFQLRKLRYCTEMVAVDVGHCYTTNCDWARYMPHLKYLIIADNPIADLSPLADLKELIYLECFYTDVTDYSPLLGCTALQDLNIGNTYGDPEILAQMPWLHNVYWVGITWNASLYEKAMLLAEQLPDTNIVLNGFRNVDRGWRQLPNYYAFREYIGGGFLTQKDTPEIWGKQDSEAILACDLPPYDSSVSQVLAEIIRYRIDNGLPIPGIKNVGSEKAEILYQAIVNSQN